MTRIVLLLWLFLIFFSIHFIVYVVLFLFLQLDRKRTQGQILPSHQHPLTKEEEAFLARPCRVIFFPGPFFYFLVSRDWANLRKQYWRLFFRPWCYHELIRTMRALVWNEGQWKSFDEYRIRQRRNERSAITLGIFIVFLLILAIYGGMIAFLV